MSRPFVERDGGRCRLAAPLAASLVERGLGDADGAMAFVDGEVLRRERYRSMVRFRLGERRYYLKRCHYPRAELFLRALVNLNFPVLSGPAEFGNLLALEGAGIPCPRPVGCGERRGPLTVRSFLVTEEVGGEPLDGFLLRRPLPPSERRRLARRLAALVAAFHGAGFRHRDLYLGNVFVRGEALTLLDCERVDRRRFGRGRAVRKDLAALDMSARGLASESERLRFLLAYTGEARFSPALRRRAARIRAKAERLARHGEKI